MRKYDKEMSDADGTRPIVGADPISETPVELSESLAAAKTAAQTTYHNNKTASGSSRSASSGNVE